MAVIDFPFIIKIGSSSGFSISGFDTRKSWISKWHENSYILGGKKKFHHHTLFRLPIFTTGQLKRGEGFFSIKLYSLGKMFHCVSGAQWNILPQGWMDPQWIYIKNVPLCNGISCVPIYLGSLGLRNSGKSWKKTLLLPSVRLTALSLSVRE